MKARTAITNSALRARLTAVGCGALIVLGISACTSGTPTSVFTPTVSGVPSSPPAGGAATSSTATGSSPATASSSSPPAGAAPVVTVTRTVTPSPVTSSPIPTAAPVTGGGGTAGLQDGLLFGIGGAAILAGAGTLAYRRRLTRNR